ncbi:phage holin family protein [bacterium]|nr:phage holin family protein [bacterium]
MVHLVLRVIFTAFALYATVYAIPGITVSGGWQTFALVAFVWVALSLSVKPVLKIVMLPITFLTVGLSSFVLNALLFWGMTLAVPGFSIDGVIPVLLGSLVFSFLTWIIHKIF